MSVYTAIDRSQLQTFLKQYSLGELIQFSGIQEGIENTNYRVITSAGDYILTVFECLTEQQLPCYLKLLNHVSELNFPAPNPQLSINKQLINTLSGKPAVLFNCLPGHSIDQPSIAHCSEIGEYLAKLHLVSQSSAFNKKNAKDLQGCENCFNQLSPLLTKKDKDLLCSEIAFQQKFALPDLPDLPKGVIHADLFKDNVLFQHGTVSAILDFYNACHDYFLYDIAVTCNDWCVENGIVNQQKITALLSGYQTIRVLTETEMSYFTLFLRRAALRFYLSRLEHQLNPKESELTVAKDPLVFRHLLDYYRAIGIRGD